MELSTIHLAILVCTAIAILIADHQSILYLFGKKHTLHPKLVRTLHRAVWTGLILMISTGLLLLVREGGYRFSEPVFFLKLAFVGVLVLNAFFIGTFTDIVSERPYAALTKEEKRTLLMSGTLSWIGWVGAATIGLFFL